MEELLKKLNDKKIHQTEWSEEMDFAEIFGEKVELIDSEVDVKRHRHYETSISVFRTSKGLVGVRLLTYLYSERAT